MAEIKKPNLYSNILGIASQPLTKEGKKFAKSIPVTKKPTTGAGITTPTQINKPMLESMKVQSETPVTTPIPVTKIGTQAGAEEKDFIQTFLDDETIDPQNRETVFEMLQDNVPRDVIEKAIAENVGYNLTQPTQEQGFLGGVAEKTGEAFMGGLGRIKEAGVGLAEGKYNFGEAAVRGGAGGLQSLFSPITGVVGETIETGIEQIPQDIRTRIKQEATPTIEGVKEWYNSQSPEQKRRLDNIGVGVELLSNFVGAKGVQKATPIVKETGKKAIKTVTPIVTKGVEKGMAIPKKIGEVGQGIKATKEQITSGLTKEQIKGFQSNPYQADEFKKLTDRLDSPEGLSDIKDYKTERVGAVTKELTDEIDKIRSTKGETSQAYKDIRQLPVEVKTDDLLSEIKTTLKNNGMDFAEDGKLIRVAGSKAKDLNQTDVSKFKQLYDDIIADSQKGYLTPDEILTFRKTASDLAKYDASSTTTGQGIMKSIRKNIDNEAKKQIPGLKELDSQFVDKLDEFENAIKDLVYKGGDVKGEWRSNIVNIVGTLDRQNRAKLLSRLEEVMPGIGEKIQAIDNLPTILKSLESKGVFEKWTGVGGAFAGASALSGIPIIGQIVGGVLGFTGGKILEKSLTGIRKSALEKVLNKVSPEGVKRLKEINTKIQKKELLKESDKTFINSLKQQFKNEIEKNKLPNVDNVNTNTNMPRSNMSNNSNSNTTGKNIKTPKKILTPKKPNKINNKGFIELNPKLPKPLKHKVSEELKPLIEEAKKYKSADEFVKGLKNKDYYNVVYHGGGDIKNFKEGKELFVSPDEYLAKSYGENLNTYIYKGGKELNLLRDYPKELYDLLVPKIKKDTLKIIDKYDNVDDLYDSGLLKQIPKDERLDVLNYMSTKKGTRLTTDIVYDNWDKIIKYAKEKGYDTILHKSETMDKKRGGLEYVILNPEKTLSKPKQIYKQAHK